MATRTWSDPNAKYRFGFNGKEKDQGDKGMGGGGSTYDYGFRIYNPNLGRFLSVDPLIKNYAMLTPYQFASNTPIRAIDVDGLEAAEVGKNNPFLIIIVLGRTAMTESDQVEPGKTQYQNLPSEYNKGDDGLALFGQYLQCNVDPTVITFAPADDDLTSNDVAQTIKNYRTTNPEGKVVLIGHSLGGKDVIDAAILVENDETIKNKTIDLVITLEATYRDGYCGEPYAAKVGGNVKNVVNYQSGQKKYTGAGAIPSDSKNTKCANITLPVGTNHTNIDNTLVTPIAFSMNCLLEKGYNSTDWFKNYNYNAIPIYNNGDRNPAATGGTSD